MTALPTPEELAERLFRMPLGAGMADVTGLDAALVAIRADREIMATALREEARELRQVARALDGDFGDGGLRDIARALRAFAGRLAPPAPERPSAETGDPIAMAAPGYCPACTGRTVLLGQPDPYDPCPVCGPSTAAQVVRTRALGPPEMEARVAARAAHNADSTARHSTPFLDASPPVAAVEPQPQPQPDLLTCNWCGAPATCLGAYEGATEAMYACDACCAHGCEDGRCEEIVQAEGARLGQGGEP